MRRIPLVLAGLLTLAFCVYSCGPTAEFGSTESAAPAKQPEKAIASSGEAKGEKARSDDAKPPSPEIEVPPLPQLPHAALLWQLPCDETAGQPPIDVSIDKDETTASYLGAGPFTQDLTGFGSAQLDISGALCNPNDQPRDIVFIVDVSGSTANSDPGDGNSCDRLDAVMATVASLEQAYDTSFGAVTFGTADTGDGTGGFSTTAGEFFADLQGTSPYAVFCRQDGGGTNYDLALLAAKAMLESSRQGTLKEIYFISDGQPSGSTGGLTAAQLKRGVMIGDENHPVKIATVQLEGSEAALKMLASSDSLGEKYYIPDVKGAQELTSALERLSLGYIEPSSILLSISGTDSASALSDLDINLIQEGEAGEATFSLESIALEDFDAEINLQLSYRDNWGNEYFASGLLKLESKD